MCFEALAFTSAVFKHKAQAELSRWGFEGTAYPCGAHDAVVFAAPDAEPFNIYCCDDPSLLQGVQVRHGPCFEHVAQDMRLLYKFGFSKAVITAREQLAHNIWCLHFSHVVPDQDDYAKQPNRRTPWQSIQPVQVDPTCPYRRRAVPNVVPPSHLEVDADTLDALFESGNFALHTDLDGFDLPDHVRQTLNACRPVTRPDRYVIYVDGSSQCRQRHRPPLWIDEHDISDSWCFAVFVEQYYHQDADFYTEHEPCSNFWALPVNRSSLRRRERITSALIMWAQMLLRRKGNKLLASLVQLPPASHFASSALRFRPWKLFCPETIYVWRIPRDMPEIRSMILWTSLRSWRRREACTNQWNVSVLHQCWITCGWSYHVAGTFQSFMDKALISALRIVLLKIAVPKLGSLLFTLCPGADSSSTSAVRQPMSETCAAACSTLVDHVLRIAGGDCGGQGSLTEPLLDYEPPAWHADIETQVNHFNNHVLDALHKQCPKQRAKPKKSCITDEIWVLRHEKLTCRQELQTLRHFQTRELMAVIFCSWKRADVDEAHRQYATSLYCRRFHLETRCRALTNRLRSELRKAKSAAIANAMHALPEMPQHQTFSTS
eukprot:s880_g26.t1